MSEQPAPQNPQDALLALVKLQAEQNAMLRQAFDDQSKNLGYIVKNMAAHDKGWANMRKQLTFFYWFVAIGSVIGCFLIYFQPF